MKKEYIKPELEEVEFTISEEITTGDLDGDMGLTSKDDTWE